MSKVIKSEKLLLYRVVDQKTREISQNVLLGRERQNEEGAASYHAHFRIL